MFSGKTPGRVAQVAPIAASTIAALALAGCASVVPSVDHHQHVFSPSMAALLTTADARGGTAAPDEPATATQDPTVGVGGAQPDTTDPATAAAPTADTAPAPAASSTTPPDADAGSTPADGSGGLSAPPAS